MKRYYKDLLGEKKIYISLTPSEKTITKRTARQRLKLRTKELIELSYG